MVIYSLCVLAMFGGTVMAQQLYDVLVGSRRFTHDLKFHGILLCFAD